MYLECEILFMEAFHLESLYDGSNLQDAQFIDLSADLADLMAMIRPQEGSLVEGVL